MIARNDDDHHPEYPRSTPEIIPPGQGDSGRRAHVYVWTSGHDGRLHLRAPSPFSIFLALAIIGLVVAIVLVVLLGALLFWIPVIILALGTLLLLARAQQTWRRWRHWVSGR